MMHIRWRIIAALAAVTTMAEVPAASRAQSPSAVGTLIVAHGAGDAWNSQVIALAHDSKTGGPVDVAFLMGPGAAKYRFQDAAQRLVAAGAHTIVVIPLLVSSHSQHYDEIRYLAGLTDSIAPDMKMHLGMAGVERAHVDAHFVVTPALDDSPELARILIKRASVLATNARAQALFLVGHGPNSAEDYAAWMRALRPVADTIDAHTHFRDVKVGLVRDDAPAEVRAEAVLRIREIIALQTAITGKPVVVVPILLGRSDIGDTKFRHDLANLSIVYSGDPLMPDPELARWVERRVRDASDTRGAAVQ